MSRPVHFEILADDPEGIAEFYQSVLGWEINAWPGNQEYWLINSGPEEKPGINGAIMFRLFQQAVINTMEVESLEATLEKVKGKGGKVVSGPNEIPGVGTHAYCADPEGILFGLLEPAPSMA
jgi:predicted enzyme related to lactoylglutathione lyase